MDLEGLVFADQITDRSGDDQILDRSDPPLTVCTRYQSLRDHHAQRFRNHHPDLALLVGGKGANDAIEGSDRVVGVQCGHHQMARFGGAQRQRDRLQIAQLADHDHVRILAQCTAQCSCK